MVRNGHGVSIRELDSRLYVSAMSQKINALPGYRTGAAFFTFLRANLALPLDDDESYSTTPTLAPFSSNALPPLGPSSLDTLTNIDSYDSYSSASSCSSNESVQSYPSSATSYSSDDAWHRADDEPVTEILWMDRDKDAAIALIKSSILQQKTNAFKSVVFHPLIVAWWIVLSALLWKICSQLELDFMTSASVIIILSVGLTTGVWTACRKYDTIANELESGGITSDDIIVGARNKDELLSAAVLRLDHLPARNKRRKTNGKGLIMAWTTKKQHRKKGLGRQVLEEIVKVGRDRAGNGMEIGFAAEHVNSQFPLPNLFNRGFKKNERMAAGALESVLNGGLLENRGIGKRRYPKR